MKINQINYIELLNLSMQHLIANALKHAAEHGLVGNSFFVINFLTEDPKVELPDQLRIQHPEEMTVILQYQYKDLEVFDEGFRVTLFFQQIPHTLYIPYQSIVSFADPGANFGLQCQISNPGEESDEQSDDGSDSTPDPTRSGKRSSKVVTNKIVSIDSFRKS